MSDIGLRSERGPILAAVLLTTALVAIDSTIIATAVPSIVGSVGGFAQFPWLFSAYLLTQAVTTPVYGRLADVVGRKPTMLAGVGFFCVGSILCGCAWSMPSLIAFRVVQGLGAGAVQPLSFTILGDLYSVEERARVQGYTATVWGVSAVLGPSVGGVFCEYFSWRLIFFVNVPLCVLAMGMLQRRFTEHHKSDRPKIDYLGAGLLIPACTLLVFGLLEGGQAWAWLSPTGFLVPALGVALFFVFALVQSRIDEPMLPLWVFTRRISLTASLTYAALGAVVLGVTSYVPTFLQDVLNVGPIAAGLALATLSVGWPLAASQSGRIYLRTSFRRCALLGAVTASGGCALMTLVDDQSPVVQVAASCFVIGLGLGLVAAPTMIAAQSSVQWNQRGVVTGNIMFSRSLGSALGIAIFGAIANSTVSDGGAGAPSPERLTTATEHVFVAATLLSIAMIIAVVAMPQADARARPGRDIREGKG